MALLTRIGGLVALLAVSVAVASFSAGDSARASANGISLREIGRFYSEEGAEISAYDPRTRQLFVAAAGVVEVLDLRNPNAPYLVRTLPLNATSVAVKNGILAVAVPSGDETNGDVYLYRTTNLNSPVILEVGNLPDMVTFTPDGLKIVVANEGERIPLDYPQGPGDLDPEGSVSVIDLPASFNIQQATARTVTFESFNGQEAALRAQGVRLFPDMQSVAQELEPEYIAISPDGRWAYVTLQENNALAVLGLNASQFSRIVPLGLKDHSLPANALDPSDEDGPSDGPAINIGTWPVFGMYLPDGIASFTVGNRTYLITANEGDDRGENERIKDLDLDPAVFTDPDIQDDDQLGRLNVSSVDGQTGPGDTYQKLYAYGARSFSIWTTDGQQVYDSGDTLERLTAFLTPDLFNFDAEAFLDGDDPAWDLRSDNKGPEPESVTIGVVNCTTYAFVALERSGSGVMVFDVSNPYAPGFVQYVRSNEDIAAEGVLFIPASESPNGRNLLVVSNEVSATVTVYEINVTGRDCESDSRNPRNPRTGGGRAR